MLLKSLQLAIALALLPACSWVSWPEGFGSQSQAHKPMELLDAAEFHAPASESVPQLAHFMVLPDDIRAELDQQVVPVEDEDRRYRALRNWVFSEYQQNYAYDPYHTAPLEDLRDSGKMNCFSFSNLFVAAARYVNVPAEFQLVKSQPQWDMSGKYLVVSQHINVTGSVKRSLSYSERKVLQAQQSATGSRVRRGPQLNPGFRYVVDLNPDINNGTYRTERIPDSTALSLFYSNRSAEAMLEQDMAAAYRFARLAVLADEDSPTAWNNLGVLLSRDRQPDSAKKAYQAALALDPNYESAASNLERIYRRLGETDQADAMLEKIIANRLDNPYYHYTIGENRVAAGELNRALEAFENAIDRKDDERLFYFALAETQIKLAKYKHAKRNLRAAKRHSTSKDLARYHQLNAQLEAATQ